MDNGKPLKDTYDSPRSYCTKAIKDLGLSTYSIEDTFSFMINAGIDMFCLGNNLDYDVNYIPKCIDAIISGIKKGKISMDLIDSSITRINSLKSKI